MWNRADFESLSARILRDTEQLMYNMNLDPQLRRELQAERGRHAAALTTIPQGDFVANQLECAEYLRGLSRITSEHARRHKVNP
jgi:hypothetical protein